MDWKDVIVAVITSGLIVAVIEIVRDWKAKRNAAKTANKENEYEAQKKGLDLVQEFYEKVTSILNANGKDVVERLDKIEARITDIEGYLNGEFKEFKSKSKKK